LQKTVFLLPALWHYIADIFFALKKLSVLFNHNFHQEMVRVLSFPVILSEHPILVYQSSYEAVLSA